MAAKNVIQIATYVTPDTQAVIQRLCKRDGITPARWLRSAIRLKLKGTNDGKQAA